MEFSATNRDGIIEQLKTQTFDILVLGGGITGAGIALDAAARGLKVALIEKGDFAQGTSSRSTKLIHGGLRYLKQLEFGIVRETGQERTILFQNAPHIVYPEKMLLPIIKGGSLGKYSTSLGLYVYDYLAGVPRGERRYMLDKNATLRAEPLLREEILLGGGMYIEYRSDDARLVIEVLKSATEFGALSLNYCKATSLNYSSDEKVEGAHVTDERSGVRFSIKAKKTINAAGPWVDELRKADKSLKGKRLHLTKGIHLVVPKDRLPVKQAVYFDVPTDGRMVFAIPRDRVVYIGTTDTNYQEDTDQCFANSSDVAYVLKAANYIFPSAELKESDVISTWAGLRPLIHEDGKAPSDLSRKDEIFISSSGLISMAGGKLTGFRKMAERAVDTALKQLAKEDKKYQFTPCSTDQIVLSGGDLQGLSIADFEGQLVERYPQFSATEVKSLARKYGSASDKILQQAMRIEGENALLIAEADYAIRQEMCLNIADFIVRRTGRLYFERPALEQQYLQLHQYFVEKLNIHPTIAEKDLQEFEEEYNGVMAFTQKQHTES
jgi:glycerol-3-phosphate dehydrogenase